MLYLTEESRMQLQEEEAMRQLPPLSSYWLCLCVHKQCQSYDNLCKKQVPFRLALRLWDIYMLEGERLLVGMSYNLIKMHHSQCSNFFSLMYIFCVNFLIGYASSLLNRRFSVDAVPVITISSATAEKQCVSGTFSCSAFTIQ